MSSISTSENATARVLGDGEPDNLKVSGPLSWWKLKKKNRKLPSRDDISVFELKDWLGDVELIDVIYGERIRYKFRLVGTNICDIDGFDATGMYTNEVFEDLYKEIIEDYDIAVNHRTPVRRERVWLQNSRGFEYKYDKLVLPFASDCEQVDVLLVYLHEI